jgi:2-keto-4-pentenoate hydratase/2-oxohepta-3-ene-1,7-dioic acid hydratase in catechol pathway
MMSGLGKAPGAADFRRLARFRLNGKRNEIVTGLVSGSRILEVRNQWRALLESWARGEQAEDLTGRIFEVTEGRFAVPAGDAARGIFCVGMNYRLHQTEVDDALGGYEKKKPVIFSKLSESLVGAEDPLSLSSEPSCEFDWEVELAAVIGRAGRHIAAAEAFSYVSGYTLVNDVTARDAQRAHSQWFLGKNVHRTTPVGPYLIHRDALDWPPDGRLQLSVNGEVKQDSSTLDMVHGIAQLIATISTYVELQPGDIIATGSPPGVGFTRKPPQFLVKGDVIRAELVGFMTMRNEVQ